MNCLTDYKSIVKLELEVHINGKCKTQYSNQTLGKPEKYTTNSLQLSIPILTLQCYQVAVFYLIVAKDLILSPTVTVQTSLTAQMITVILRAVAHLKLNYRNTVRFDFYELISKWRILLNFAMQPNS